MLSESELRTVEVVEEEEIDLRGKLVIQGFPGMGLVGTIAAHHLVTVLNARLVGSLSGVEMPPIAVVHGGKPLSPVRIYSTKDLVIVVSEIAIPSQSTYTVSKALVDWYEQKGAKQLVVLGGLGEPDRVSLEQLAVFGVPTNEYMRNELESQGIKILPEGLLIGPLAVTLRESIASKVPAYGILSQCYAKFPDPNAAARVLETLSKLTGIEVDLKALFERAEELKVQMRDLAKRTDIEAQSADQEGPTTAGAPKTYYS